MVDSEFDSKKDRLYEDPGKGEDSESGDPAGAIKESLEGHDGEP